MNDLKLIPLFDMEKRLNKHRDVITAAINRVIDGGNLVLGHEVDSFEKEFALSVGVNFAIGVANGTDALEISMRALGVGKNTLVGMAANAGGYARIAAELIGAEIIYADVDKKSHCISLKEVMRLIKRGAEIIVITHLYGLTAPEIGEISKYCSSHSVKLIEDCAQAHGSFNSLGNAGTFGDISTFSFYPTKNLGAIGDAGCITTNNDELAQKVRQHRTYGWSQKYQVDQYGGRNSRLDALQAAILRDLLPFLKSENDSRRRYVEFVVNNVSNPFISFINEEGNGSNCHLFVALSPERDKLMAHLKDQGVDTGIHYPIPDHHQKVWKVNENPNLEVTEFLSKHIVTLPCFPDLTLADADRVVSALNTFSPY